MDIDPGRMSWGHGGERMSWGGGAGAGAGAGGPTGVSWRDVVVFGSGARGAPEGGKKLETQARMSDMAGSLPRSTFSSDFEDELLPGGSVSPNGVRMYAIVD